jgi:hypothetical protein
MPDGSSLLLRKPSTLPDIKYNEHVSLKLLLRSVPGVLLPSHPLKLTKLLPLYPKQDRLAE